MVRLIIFPVKKCVWCFLILLLIMIWNNINLRSNEPNMNKEKDQFYVNSGRCQMPYVNPFNAEVMKVYKPFKFIPCTNESDLVTVHYDEFIKKYFLHINEEVVHQMIKLNENAVSCFYQKIIYGQHADVYDR